MSEPGSSLVDGLLVVATKATRVKLPTAPGSTGLKRVIVQALSTNEGEMVVGAVTCVALKGSHATPTRRGVTLKAGDKLELDVNDSADVWLDAETSGDGVTYVDIVV